jgi:DNA-binding NarL/FixJ family response regulator
MSLNQTVRGLIDRLPTLTSEERWVVQAVLDMADQRSRLIATGDVPSPKPPPVPLPERRRNEPAYYARLSAAPYYVTMRELEVLDLLLSGLSNKEVAGKLGISFKTVQAHRQRVMDKLGARSPMHLAEIVRRAGVS